MRMHWGILVVGVLAAAEGRAATVAETLTSLAGEWQGAELAPIGHATGNFHLVLTPTTPAVPGGSDLGKVRLGDDGDGLMAAQDFAMVQSGGQCFAALASDNMAEGAFAIEHAPFGGLRFHRLVRVAAAEGQTAVRAEEVVLGKAAADGTRRLKVTRGEKLCRDAAGVTTICAAAESRLYSVKR